MRFGINLRSDLKQLSDAELAVQLDRLIDYRATRFGSRPAVGSFRCLFKQGLVWPFGRGPVHHRTAYKLWIGYYWIFRGPVGTLYLVECEIKDIRDEMQRRVASRKAAPWVTQ